MSRERLLPALAAGDMDAVKSALDEFSSDLAVKFDDDRVRRAATRAADIHLRTHKRNFTNQLKRRLGINIVGANTAAEDIRTGIHISKKFKEPVYALAPNMAIEGHRQRFIDNSVRLMDNLRNTVAAGIRRDVEMMIETGEVDVAALTKKWRTDGVPSLINTTDGVRSVSTKNHSLLIARDQIATMNSELTETRQTSVGIEEFIWQDQDDSRVRQLHAALDGKKFTWAEGADGLYPGRPVNCRCWARAVIDKDKIMASGGLVNLHEVIAV